MDDRTRRTLSRVDKTYTDLLQVLTDEAKEGPRLFSLVPVDRNNFNPRNWIRAEFQLTLWCEHSRQPLTSPDLNGAESTKGVYKFEIEREWFKKVAPYLKVVMGTLSLVLPVISSGIKLKMDDTAYKAIEEQLDYGKSVIEATIGEGEKIGEWMGATETSTLEKGEPVRAQGAMLREFHALLKLLDKTENYGGLIKVLNKRQEFLWVHERFAGEY